MESIASSISSRDSATLQSNFDLSIIINGDGDGDCDSEDDDDEDDDKGENNICC